jgi:arylsulfatase A-like enzyme
LRIGTLPRWIASGAAAGAALALAEVCVGYLAGGRYPLAWWGFLALYNVPALAAAGALLGLGRRVDAGAAEAARAVVDVLAFVYVVVAVNHEYLKALSYRDPWRLATVVLGVVLAWLHSRRQGRLIAERQADPRRELAFQLARPLCLVAAACCAWSVIHLQNRTAASLAFLVLSFALADLAGAALARLLAGTAGRRLALGGAAALALFCVQRLTVPPPGTLRDDPLATPGEGAPGDRPNIVMVVLDTVSAADVSPTATPALAAFAKKAVVYSQCLSPSPWSIPAHASLFTGLFPPQHGAGFAAAAPPCRPRGLDDRVETLAERLARRGYATAAIVANQPTFEPVFGLDRGFRFLDARLPRERVDLRFPPLVVRLEGRLPLWAVSDLRVRWLGVAWRPAEEVVREALAWLDRPLRQPYFLFLNFMDAHTPFAPRAGDSELARSPRLPLYGRPDGRWSVPLDAEESRHLRSLRSEAIRRLDRQLALLLDSLERRSEWASTWVVITSDHGEAVSEERLFGHNCATLSQEVLHVPLIVRDPRVPGRAGSRDDRPVQLVDLAPELLRAVGAEAERGAEAGLTGTRRAQLALSYCNCPRLQPGAEDGAAEAIVEGGYKYVRIGLAPPRLFDLAGDPGERRDLAASDTERLERLRASLEDWKQDASRRRLPGPGAPTARLP